MGHIDFSKEAIVIDRLVRGMNPWPSAYTSYKGKQLKIWRVLPILEPVTVAPGTVTNVTKDYIEVATGAGTLRIYELQLEGKKRMTTHDFLLGVKVQPGETLGE